MIPKGLFTQIIMLVMAVGITFAYVQPAFSTIGGVQDMIAVYRAEREKVESVNRNLQVLVDKMSTIPAEDRVALLTYIPDIVDVVAVPRDLQSMSKSAGLILRSVSPEDTSSTLTDSLESGTVLATPYVFQVSVEGNYGQIKSFLSLIERNNYPLDIQQLTLEPHDGSFMSATMEIVTYGHLPAPEIIVPVTRRR